MNENLTILKKGLILIAVPFAFLIIFVGILLKINADAEVARSWTLHSKEVIFATSRMMLELIRSQSNARLLVLVDHPVILREFEAELANLPSKINALPKLVEDNPDQTIRCKRIVEDANALVQFEVRLKDLIQARKRPEAVALISSLDGQTKFESTQNAVHDFLEEERRLDSIRVTHLAATARYQTWILYGALLTSLILVLVLAVTFRKAINDRFAVLTDNAQRLAEGKELSVPLEGRDEIAQVDHVFHLMAQALTDKNRENEMFIYSVSHDLRSPLVNLQGFSQELSQTNQELRDLIEASELNEASKDQMKSLIDNDTHSSIKFIQSAVSRLSVIIDALLRLSRAGRIDYRWEMVNLGDLIQRVVDALADSIAQNNAEIVVHPIPPVWGDATALEQMFGNLIVNAVHYLDSSRPGRIEIGTQSPPDGNEKFLTYYVRDNGVGIPESAMPRLFLAFQRFHEGKAKGEGIGLALVRRIVERHGGRVRVESVASQGTTFSIDLPIRPPESASDNVARLHELRPRGL